MNINALLSVIAGIILLNNSLFTIIPLPGIIDTLALGVAAFYLLKGFGKGSAIGKIYLVVGIIIAIFALSNILGFVGIGLPFIGFLYKLYRISLIIGGVLLLLNPFYGG